MNGTQWTVVLLWLVLCWFGFRTFDSWCNSKVKEAEQKALEASMETQRSLAAMVAQIARHRMERQP